MGTYQGPANGIEGREDQDTESPYIASITVNSPRRRLLHQSHGHDHASLWANCPLDVHHSGGYHRWH